MMNATIRAALVQICRSLSDHVPSPSASTVLKMKMHNLITDDSSASINPRMTRAAAPTHLWVIALANSIENIMMKIIAVMTFVKVVA